MKSLRELLLRFLFVFFFGGEGVGRLKGSVDSFPKVF